MFEFSRYLAAAAGRWRHCYDDEKAPSGEHVRMSWRHECGVYLGRCFGRCDQFSFFCHDCGKWRSLDVVDSMLAKWRTGFGGFSCWTSIQLPAPVAPMMMMSMTRLGIFYVVVPLLQTLTWQPRINSVPTGDLRRPAASANDWRPRSRPSVWSFGSSSALGLGSRELSSRSRSRPIGWGAGMQDRRRYGDDYDASEEDEPAAISLRMPGVYVQQVRRHHHHHHHLIAASFGTSLVTFTLGM